MELTLDCENLEFAGKCRNHQTTSKNYYCITKYPAAVFEISWEVESVLSLENSNLEKVCFW